MASSLISNSASLRRLALSRSAREMISRASVSASLRRSRSISFVPTNVSKTSMTAMMKTTIGLNSTDLSPQVARPMRSSARGQSAQANAQTAALPESKKLPELKIFPVIALRVRRETHLPVRCAFRGTLRSDTTRTAIVDGNFGSED